MQNNNATTVKGNYNSNQNQMNRQQGIKGQNNINQNIQANNIPQGNNMQNNIDFTRVPVVTTVNNLIVTAVNLGASDMHFDPTEDGIIVRFRIDGLLRNYVSLPQEIKQNVITRIKIMAGMNITETRLPQDGAIKDKLNGKDLDDKATMLRATCAIPLLFPVIKINGKEYYDGGLCDPIPIKKAIADGNTKHLIVLTQPKGYKKELSKKNILVAKLLNKKYPNLKTPLLNRHNHYNETVKFCEQLENEGKVLILRPEYNLDSFEKDINKLKSSYDHGYNLAINHLSEIKKLFD